MLWNKKYYWVGNFYFKAVCGSYTCFMNYSLLNRLNPQPQIGYTLYAGKYSFTITKTEFHEYIWKKKNVFVFNAVVDDIDFTQEWSRGEVANDPLIESNRTHYFYREYISAITTLEEDGWSGDVPGIIGNCPHWLLFRETQKGKYEVTDQDCLFYHVGQVHGKLPDIHAVHPLAAIF